MTITQTLLVPLHKLAVSPVNVRKTGGTKIDDLAAMIDSQGLLHRLTVVPSATGKAGCFDVVAGNRRLKALRLLAGKKKLAKSEPIECLLVSTENATAASLSENIGREAMHPADQYLAFQALIAEGKSVADVAASFGVSELTVSRRMKLAQVSPRLFEQYRKDKMTLEQLMQFTLTDDHEKQESVWKSSPDWQRSPQHLRALLTEGEVSATDPMVVFVGIDAYQSAGGVVRTDLFTDDGDGFVTDAALLSELATAKLEAIADQYRTAGWKWVEARPRCGYSDLAAFRKIPRGFRDPSDMERFSLEVLDKAIAAANQAIEAAQDDDSDDGDEALYKALDTVENAREEFIQTLTTWTPEQLAVAGVIVAIDNEGKAQAHEGLVRPEDQKALRRVSQGKALAEGDTEAIKSEHSERLTGALTAHRNAAIQALLVKRPEVALVALVHSMVLQSFEVYRCSFTADPLQVKANTVAHVQRSAAPDIDQSAAGLAFNQSWATWEGLLPKDGTALFAWLLALSAVELQELLTLCIAASVNTMASRDVKGLPGQALASVLGLDMADWWQPTAEGYLKHVSKAQIIAAVSAAKSADAAKLLPKKGKSELVVAAETALRDTRWLPAVLKS